MLPGRQRGNCQASGPTAEARRGASLFSPYAAPVILAEKKAKGVRVYALIIESLMLSLCPTTNLFRA